MGGEGYRGPGGGEAYRGPGGGEAYRGPGGGEGYRGPGGGEGFRGPEGGEAYRGPGGNYAYHGSGGATGYGHTGFPTDGAFGQGWSGAAGYGAIGHNTTPWSGNVAAAQAAAVRNGFGNYGAFGAGWYGAHPGAWAAAGWAAGAAWNAAAWPAVNSWCGWAANAQPVTYEYGNNVTYQGDQVYYGQQPVATADQYYQQASTIAQSAPAPDAASNEWMPLGVFSLVQGGQTDSSALFQLALSKSGAIAGNYYSPLTETTLPVQGSVDKATQRAAWTVGDNKTNVYEGGITGLTKDETPLLLHLGKDRTQQWMLVRMKQPEQAGQQ